MAMGSVDDPWRSKKGGKAKPLSAKVSIFSVRNSLQRTRRDGIDSATPFLHAHENVAGDHARGSVALDSLRARAWKRSFPSSSSIPGCAPCRRWRATGALKLLAPNRFVVDWVNANLLPRIGELLRDESTGRCAHRHRRGRLARRHRCAAPPATGAAADAAAARRRPGRRRAPQSGFHLRHASSRARAISSPRPPRCRSPRIPAAPTTRCSSTAASASARRT